MALTTAVYYPSSDREKVQSLDAFATAIVENLEPDFNAIEAVATRLLESSLLDSDLRENARTISESTRAAARAIHYLSSITDRQPAQLKSVDPCEVLRALRPLLAHLVGDSVALEISCADHVWPVKASLEDLELIISSLSANARDAMPDGGKLRWSVTNVAVSEDHVAYAHGIPIGNYVLIGVADTGCGISPDLIDRIFEPFFSTKSGRGNGTGLSLVYRAILGMQGHILVRSESNRGSKFELFLPAVPISK